MRIPLAVVPLLLVAQLAAQEHHPAPAGTAVGTVRFPTSCRATAQPEFDRAVAMLHSFAFAQAIDGFRTVLDNDPECAIAWWGIALATWGNPFAAGVKPPAQIQRGLEAITRARAVRSPTARESRYIEAAARLYERADSTDQRTRLLSHRDAMADLVAQEPADTEAAIFHALALAITADPADKTFTNQLQAGATLERLFAKLPNHPGLAHYIIHTYDVPPLAGRAGDAARRYSRIAPALSHALHMPSHTYTRVGEWQRSVDANVGSAAAALREGSITEELHAADYRIYALLQLGQISAARRILVALPAVAARLNPNAPPSAAPLAAGYFAIAAIPARYALERGAWAEAARLEVKPSPFPFADAITWFTRGLGAARIGDTAAAATAVAELVTLRERLRLAGEGYWSEQVEIQRSGVAAWRSFAAGRTEEALTAMAAAAEREGATEKNAMTPGPLAPARELLGEMLLAANRPKEALAAFELTLRHEPNRYRTVAGAAEAARKAGDQAATWKYSAELSKLRAGADRSQ